MTLKIFYQTFFIIFFLFQNLLAQKVIIEGFENLNDWKIFQSDGVKSIIKEVTGLSGKAIRFEYDFTKGAGYGGIQKLFSLELPENYQLTFYLRANSPNNNFEIKFLDQSGENVWWMNNRDYTFPTEWKKFTIKKRHIEFAWGPKEDKSFKEFHRIEFTIASFNGGKGWIELDELSFEPLPSETESKPVPLINASSEFNNTFSVKNIFDENVETKWLSSKSLEEKIELDFQIYREIGGFIIDWDRENYPIQYQIYLADSDQRWEKIFEASANSEQRSYVRLLNAEGRKALIVLKNSSSQRFGIRELKILEPKFSEDLNQFFIHIAKDYPRGFFPRYFYKEKSYWNVVGVKSDFKEALINEEGMIEVDKSRFSIEPMFFLDEEIITWNDVELEQSLEDQYLPIPIVIWNSNKINLQIKTFASGTANKNSTLYCIYKISNNSSSTKKGKFFLLLRPFQVNPFYQSLNLSGGVSGINSIRVEDFIVKVDSDKYVYPISNFNEFGAMKFESGNIVSSLNEGKIPKQKTVTDDLNLASGLISYNFELNPGEIKEVVIAIPFYEKNINVKLSNDENLNLNFVKQQLEQVKEDWNNTLSYVKFNLPQSVKKIINTYKSNLAYILINRDGYGIQPGSRSYERSWIRDGSLTSSALLKSGIVEEVREFIDWYSEHQFEDGKVPCVVDKRGPDPVPEHDSHGEYIFLIKQYFNFTKDTSVLKKHNSRIIKAVDYLKSLIEERSTEHFKNGNDSIRAYYGILPESISHEGYSAKPMHSYWDNFFALRGLKDAVDIQNILGNKLEYDRINNIRDKFKTDLYNSLSLAIKARQIDYIPGCVELGDFDATSTTIALYPVNEKINLPQPYLNNTFNKYYEYFNARRVGKYDWVNYTPYENRIIVSFIFLGQSQRAHELVDFFLKDLRPFGWNHWAEVVWKDYRFPGFIGDMPHSWVGSDFINAIRSMFVYENDYDSSIIIGAGLRDEWINSNDGISVENLPTYYGNLSYSIRKNEDYYSINIYGDIILPSGKLILKNFNSDYIPNKVLINDKSTNNYNKENIIIDEFPSEIKIYY